MTPLDASTTETAKPSNQELALRWEDSGGATVVEAAAYDALVARVEALLAERDALRKQLLGGGRAACGTASLHESRPGDGS